MVIVHWVSNQQAILQCHIQCHIQPICPYIYMFTSGIVVWWAFSHLLVRERLKQIVKNHME